MVQSSPGLYQLATAFTGARPSDLFGRADIMEDMGDMGDMPGMDGMDHGSHSGGGPTWAAWTWVMALDAN